MAEDDKKKTVLPGSFDPTSLTHQKIDLPRKRHQRCKTASLADYRPRETNETEDLLSSESIFGRNHPSIRESVTMMLAHLVLGTVLFYLVRHQITGVKTDEVLDSVYFSVVTMTTVGYGDLVPNTVAAKLLSSGYVFSGVTLVCLFLSTLVDRLLRQQAVLLVKAICMPHKADPSEILKEVETTRARYRSFVAIIILVLHMVAGTVILCVVEKLNILDAFYCVCSTITTLGYGDKSFSTVGGRVFAIFWILTSTLSLGQFFIYLAHVALHSRQKALVKWILSRKMTSAADLEEADIDDDGNVRDAEFALNKLKEMGKITQEDISLAMDEFKNLGGDQSGTLSASHEPHTVS